MKQRIKYAIEHGIQNALQIFRLLPLQNRVNFIAFSGRQYSDSPRRISELLRKEHPEIQQVWAFNEPEKLQGVLDTMLDGVLNLLFHSFTQ